MNFRQNAHPGEALSPYLDGEVTADERARIEAHLAGCASCRTLLEDFRVLAAAEVLEGQPPMPAELRARIRRSLPRQQVSGGAANVPRIWSHRLGLAAAAGLVLVIGLWALRRETAPPDITPGPGSIVSDNAGDSNRPTAETGEAPPGAGGREISQESMQHLKSLGHLGGQTQPKEETPGPPPAASRKSAARSLRQKQAPAPATTQPRLEKESPRAPAATEWKDLATSPGAPPAGAAATEALPYSFRVAKSRSLLLELPAYRVSVSEDGTVALSVGTYECAARLAGPSVDPEVTALFTLASSGGAEAPHAETGPRVGPVVRLIASQASAGRAAGAALGQGVPSREAMEIETRLRALLRDRYLPLMEGRCGPAPGAVHSP